jgi:hypothetical protein
LASPKSSTFTVPSDRTLMFAGFRSRWMIPCSCAASRASAICFGDRSRFLDPERAARDALREILALYEFHHEGAHAAGFFQAVNVRDVRMIEGGEGLGFACEPGEAVAVVGDRVRQDFKGDIAIELRVAGAGRAAPSPLHRSER